MITTSFQGSYKVDEIALGKSSQFLKGGVYFWTFPHQNKLSVVYAGEADCYMNRFKRYRNEIPKLEHYFVKPDMNDSVYSLLQQRDFKKLFQEQKFWSPGIVTENPEWAKDAASNYKNLLQVFLLPLEAEYNTLEIRQKLESQILRKLINGLKLVTYGNGNCRLGKISYAREDLFDLKFKLSNFPQFLESRTRELLEGI